MGDWGSPATAALAGRGNETVTPVSTVPHAQADGTQGGCVLEFDLGIQPSVCSLQCGGRVFGPMAGSYLMLITPPSQAGRFLSMLSAGKLRKVLDLAELPSSGVTAEAKHEAWKPTVPRERAASGSG